MSTAELLTATIATWGAVLSTYMFVMQQREKRRRIDCHSNGSKPGLLPD